MNSLIGRLVGVVVFAAAFAFVESAIVVYLRELYYPAGFTFPLKLLPQHILLVELAREVATLVMLMAAGVLLGKTPWERFALFILAFGVWDIFYYVWLKILLDWPASLVDWDVLFLIPMPWIGPVIAPVIIATMMCVCGIWIVLRIRKGLPFTPGRSALMLAVAATLVALYSFTYDTDATLRGAMPRPYRYELLAGTIILYSIAFALSCKSSNPSPSS